MAVKIEIVNQQKKISIPPPKIIKIVKAVLKIEGVRHANLSIAFVTDRKIRALNKQFLNRNHATDVLAFDLTDSVASRSEKSRTGTVEGDIIISTITAYHNSKRFQTAIGRELTLYIVHGLLHLLGYDDRVLRDVQKMRRKEEEILEQLGEYL